MMTILAGIFLTLTIYLLVLKLHHRLPFIAFHPLFLCPLLIIILLILFRWPYEAYAESTPIFTTLLQLATVAFALPLYRNRRLLRIYAPVIIISIVAGSLLSLTTSVLLGQWFHLDRQTLESLAPRSVTTPIAMNISDLLGGIPSITAVLVITTGLSGILIGPWIIRFLKIETALARGLLLGMGAHGTGTAKAFSFGKREGAMAGLAMILAGLSTFLMAPWLITILLAG